MRNNEKGFVFPILIIIFALMVGGLVFFASKYQDYEIKRLEEKNVFRTPQKQRIEEEKKEIAIKQEKKEIELEEIVFSPKIESKTDLMTPSPIIEPVIKPTPIPTPEFFDETSPLPINLRSIVGLLCFFDDSEGNEYKNRGSGMIIDFSGTILTNRHIVEKQGWNFKHCLVGIPNEYLKAPLIGDIRVFNILDRISLPLMYYAKISFKPDISILSEAEKNHLDFIILKISGTYNDVLENGVQYVIPYPIEFSFTSLDNSREVLIDEEVVSFGYEGENVQKGHGDFNTFRLQGWTGRIKKIFVGDDKLRGINVSYSSDMTVRQGQSGSPVFTKSGKFVGLIFAGGEDKQGADFSETSYIISISAIETFFEWE